MIVLNLGCGTKTSSHPDVVNIDWSIMLRLRRFQPIAKLAGVFLDAGRRERLGALPSNVLVHDLSKGIPFDDRSVDVVYHSHMLEHLDRDVAALFLREVLRVLRPGGIHRIVVPDFAKLCRDYLSHYERASIDQSLAEHHDVVIGKVIEQCVRRESFGSSQQKPWRRRLENAVLGDARQRGETHQWMYDDVSLSAKLRSAGYQRVDVCAFDTSNIPGWNFIGLDLDSAGSQYRPGSVYIEAFA